MTEKPNTGLCLMSPKIISVTTQSRMPSPLLMEEAAPVHSVLLQLLFFLLNDLKQQPKQYLVL